MLSPSVLNLFLASEPSHRWISISTIVYDEIVNLNE